MWHTSVFEQRSYVHEFINDTLTVHLLKFVVAFHPESQNTDKAIYSIDFIPMLWLYKNLIFYSVKGISMRSPDFVVVS